MKSSEIINHGFRCKRLQTLPSINVASQLLFSRCAKLFCFSFSLHVDILQKNKLKSIKIRSREFTLVAKLLNSQKTKIELIIEISESITFETFFNLFSQRRASFTKRIHLQPYSSRYFQSRNMFKKSVVEVRFRNSGIDTTL